jgi:hypothetical protein
MIGVQVNSPSDARLENRREEILVTFPVALTFTFYGHR